MNIINHIVNNKVVFISSALPKLSNYRLGIRHRDLANSIRSIGLTILREAQGVYKGNEESSFCVEYHSDSELNELIGLAKHFNQECILAVEYGIGRLYYDVDNSKAIGSLKRITREEAKHLDNYTMLYPRAGGSYTYLVVR